MAEFLKLLSANMLERLVVAVLAAIMTTYILQQRNEGRIEVLERDALLLQQHAENDERRFALCEQRLERIETLVEIHMQLNSKGTSR